MTQERLLQFLRAARRPYASIICSTSLAGVTVAGAFTGNWIPAALAGTLILVILGDTAARSLDKQNGSD